MFGGTFNPVHLGHLGLAEAALRQIPLDECWWIPAHHAPHKELEGAVSAEDRARMVGLAIEGNPAFRLSRVELDRPAPSYTIDTVRLLQRQHPEHQWFFLIGADTAQELPSWREIDSLRALVQFVAIPRPGIPAAPAQAGAVRWIQAQSVPISSSEIRQRIRRGDSIDTWVPRQVARYIRERGFYR